MKNYQHIVKQISEQVSFLTRPISSSETRKEGRQFLVLSAILILLAAHIIQIGSGSFFGLSIDLEKKEWVVYLLLIVCSYMAIIYCFDLFHDEKQWRRQNSIENKKVKELIKELQQDLEEAEKNQQQDVIDYIHEIDDIISPYMKANHKETKFKYYFRFGLDILPLVLFAIGFIFTIIGSK